MINIILSPSQQKWNACAMGDSEQDHCFTIGQKVFDYIRNYECKCMLIPPILGSEAHTLNEVVRMSNAFVKDNPAERSFHLDIHTDAGGYAKGSSGFYTSESGKGFIIEVWRQVSALTPWGDGTCTKRDNLAVLNNTLAIAGLIELSFHDNKIESEWVHMNMDQLGKAICAGIVNYAGLKPKVAAVVKDWRYDALKFAIENKISDGTRPRDAATREEIWAMFENYDKLK